MQLFLAACALPFLGCDKAPDPLPLDVSPQVCDPATFAEPVCADPSDTRIETILASCAGSNCHGSDNPAANLSLVRGADDLTIKDTLDDFVGTPSWWDACSHRALINLDALDCSFLLEKVMRQPECGDQMPPATPPMPQEDIDCLRLWLRNNYGVR